MRLWSIDPVYLDQKGLCACWRESLLAKQVLQKKTEAYKNHPQLLRFKQKTDKINCINIYLLELYKEAKKRNYSFNFNKIFNKNNANANFYKTFMTVTNSQLAYEFKHLQKKLERRDVNKYQQNNELFIYADGKIKANPIFHIIKGDIESWEKIK